MPLKSWASNLWIALAALAAIVLTSGARVQTQAPFVVFGSNSGVSQPIKSTSNALWVSLQSGGNIGTQLFGDGTATNPSIAFFAQSGFGFSRPGASQLLLSDAGTKVLAFTTSAGGVLTSNRSWCWTASTTDPTVATEACLSRASVNVVGTSNLITDGTDSTLVEHGALTRQRNSYTITPATGGAGNCGAAFLAAALTADCTVATLPAGMKLVSVYADVTAGFTCSGTCTGTKVVQVGTAAGGTQVLAAGLNVAATGTFGLADADLGSGMTRAAAIQGGLVGSWSATTPISARFTSGTGNWGNGAATFVNAGSIKFILGTEQIK